MGEEDEDEHDPYDPYGVGPKYVHGVEGGYGYDYGGGGGSSYGSSEEGGVGELTRAVHSPTCNSLIIPPSPSTRFVAVTVATLRHSETTNRPTEDLQRTHGAGSYARTTSFEWQGQFTREIVMR